MGGKGTGSPLDFRCSQCTRHGSVREGWADRVRLTGKVRRYKRGSKHGPRGCPIEWAYKCLDCRHLGWSNHMDLRRLICVGE